jgi:hypothetical protein
VFLAFGQASADVHGDEQALAAAAARVREVAAPAFAARLTELCLEGQLEIAAGDLSGAMHAAGLNVRDLGLVYAALPAAEAELRIGAVLCEMVVRGAKHSLKLQTQAAAAAAAEAGRSPGGGGGRQGLHRIAIELAATMLTAVLGRGAASDQFWGAELPQLLEKKFCTTVLAEDLVRLRRACVTQLRRMAGRPHDKSASGFGTDGAVVGSQDVTLVERKGLETDPESLLFVGAWSGKKHLQQFDDSIKTKGQKISDDFYLPDGVSRAALDENYEARDSARDGVLISRLMSFVAPWSARTFLVQWKNRNAVPFLSHFCLSVVRRAAGLV